MSDNYLKDLFIDEVKPALQRHNPVIPDPVIESITITESGTYTAPEGIDGYSPITVNVASSDDVASAIVSRTITEYADNSIRIIGEHAFQGCSNLTTVNCPSVTSIGNYAFTDCSKLTTAEFPLLTSISGYAFDDCSRLTSVEFPLLTSISNYAFRNCYRLTSAEFSLLRSISSYAFYGCYSLTSVILRKDSIVTLSNTNAFGNCHHLHGTVHSTYNPDGLKDGYIYVPSALVESYKTASNWSNFATQFRALEDYTVDGTTTGALDPNKI